MRIPGLGSTSPIDLIKRSVREFSKDDMTTYAAALSYHTLFALFPFLIFLVTLLGFLNIPGFFDWLLGQAETAFPQDAFQRVEEVINQVQNQTRGGLLSFGIVTAIWAASSGIRSVMNAMNVAFDVEESRPAWKRYLLSIGYTLGLAVLLIAAAGLMLLGPQVMESIADQAGLGNLFVTLWTWLRWPVLAVLLTLTAAIVYYVAPNVDQPFAFITPGAALAVIIWIVSAIGFSVYFSNFADYSVTYGSLGGVIVLLFFFFISSAVLLLGAEINAELYKAEIGEPTPEAGSNDEATGGNA